jgi:hypothetical protein
LLIFDAFAGFDTFIKGVLDFHHFGYQVGHLENAVIGIATGKDKLYVRRSVFDELDDVVKLDEFIFQGDIHFVQHHKVIAAAVDGLTRGCQGCFRLLFFLRLDIKGVGKLPETGFKYLDIGEFEQGFKFAVGIIALHEKNDEYFKAVTGRPEYGAQGCGRLALAVAGKDLDQPLAVFSSQLIPCS